jgi:hypothetical protein
MAWSVRSRLARLRADPATLSASATVAGALAIAHTIDESVLKAKLLEACRDFCALPACHPPVA